MNLSSSLTFQLTILGSSSAVPTLERNQTAQILNIHEKLILIDAGEGTQKQFLQYQIKSSKIDVILISHLHPDHFIGLIGIVCSFNLKGRKEPLTIIGPKGIAEIIEVQLKYSQNELSYPLLFIDSQVPNNAVIFNNEQYQIRAIQLEHRIPCTGYLIEEKIAPFSINVQAEGFDNVPREAFSYFKQGKDYKHSDDQFYHYEDYTLPNHKARSYAFLSDTRPMPQLIKYFKGATALYHDCTFDKSLADKAYKTFHTTTEQAAILAKEAQVAHLLLGHFSTRYKHLEPLLLEAQEIFESTSLATEGEIFNFNFNTK